MFYICCFLSLEYIFFFFFGKQSQCFQCLKFVLFGLHTCQFTRRIASAFFLFWFHLSYTRKVDRIFETVPFYKLKNVKNTHDTFSKVAEACNFILLKLGAKNVLQQKLGIFMWALESVIYRFSMNFTDQGKIQRGTPGN